MGWAVAEGTAAVPEAVMATAAVSDANTVWMEAMVGLEVARATGSTKAEAMGPGWSVTAAVVEDTAAVARAKAEEAVPAAMEMISGEICLNLVGWITF